MLRSTLAGVRARATRLLLSSAAIVLGVAFVTGTLVLGDAIQADMEDSFARQARNVDVLVRLSDDIPIPDEEEEPNKVVVTQLDTVRRVDGVDSAEVRTSALTHYLNPKGKATQAAAVVLPGDDRLVPMDTVEGRLPQSDTEVGISQRIATAHDLTVGRQLELLDGEGNRHSFTVSGIFEQAPQRGMLYLSDQIALRPEALDSLGVENWSVGEIAVIAANGVDPAVLADRVRAALGKPYLEVLTGDEFIRMQLESLAGQAASGFTQVLLSFAALALVVAAMVIHNTFTILLTQRTRELALLRCIGAGRGQVFRSVLLEALVMGLVASAVGLAAGLGLSAALQAGLAVLEGEGIRDSIRLPLTGQTVLVGMLTGVLVTVASAVLPAWRATRVPPIAALRTLPDSAEEVARTGWLRRITAVVFALGGVALAVLANRASGEGSLLIAGVATAALLIAVVALGPVVVGPLNRLLGPLPTALFGVPARLAATNAGRNPRRTAATTSALLVGVTIVTMATVVAHSVKQAVAQALREEFPTDVQVVSSVWDVNLPDSLPGQLSALPEVELAVPIVEGAVMLGEHSGLLLGIDPVTPPSMLEITMVEGELRRLEPGTVSLASEAAAEAGIGVGDQVRLTADEQEHTLRVAALHSDDQQHMAIVSLDTFRRMIPGVEGVHSVLVDLRDGVDAGAGRAAVERVTDPIPVAQVISEADSAQEMSKQVDQLLALVWALLAMAVVIALFGIANTLTLSVLQRTRESALLRALGLTRGQLRLMLFVEAVLMSLMGVVLGLTLGGIGAWVTTTALSNEKISVPLTVPYTQLAVLVLVTLVAALGAAVLPARRAARTSVVSALAAD